jgi:hypothetical protein
MRLKLLLFTSVMNVERIKIGAEETITFRSTNLVNTFVQMPHLCLVHHDHEQERSTENTSNQIFIRPIDLMDVWDVC